MPRSGLRVSPSPAKTRYGVVIDADFPMCQICKKTFSSKSSRKRHLLGVHGVSDDHVDGRGDQDDTVTWCHVCTKYHGPLEDDLPVRSSSVLSYISVAQSVSGEEVGNAMEEEVARELNNAIVEEVKEDVAENNCSHKEGRDSPFSYISVTPSIKEIDEDIKSSISCPMRVSCLSFDIEDTFPSSIGRNNQSKNAQNEIIQSKTQNLMVHDENQNVFCDTDKGDLIKKAAKKIYHECPECGKRFKNKDDKRRHEERVHMKGRDFQCSRPGCVKSFFTLQEYERHFKSCKTRRSSPCQRNNLPKDQERFRISILPFEKPSNRPDILHAPVKHPGLDWSTLVSEHKTNKFAVIPLYYRNNPPETIGTCLRRNVEETQSWGMRAPSEDVIEMEANVYTLRIPTATYQNSQMVIDFEHKMKGFC